MTTSCWHYTLWCLGVFLLNEVFLGGQTFFEDFENPEILNDWKSNDLQRWEITTMSSLSGSFSLHHGYDSPSADSDYIFHRYPFLLNFTDTLIWQFTLKHDYLPSSANNWGFYLATDCILGKDQCLSSGIVIGVNLTGSDDGLNLYQIKGKKLYPLPKSKFNWEENVGTNQAIIKIIRTPAGLFQLWVTSQNQSTPVLVEEAFCDVIPSSCYFGFQYTYSSSQDRKIWVDDIKIISKPINKSIFKVDTFYINNSQQVIIQLNQPLNESSELYNSIVIIPTLSFSTDVLCDRLIINLLQPFDKNNSYYLQIHNLFSINNNKIDTVLELNQYLPQPFDFFF